MSILGTPGVRIFANDHAITTTPADTAYTVSATASMDSGQFLVHRIARDCEFRPDGSHLRFGTELVIDGVYPHFMVRRSHPNVVVELEIDATDKVAHFANVPGLYRHWSLLARYRGHIDYRHHRDEVEGLCTFEYSSGQITSAAWGFVRGLGGRARAGVVLGPGASARCRGCLAMSRSRPASRRTSALGAK